MEIFDGHRALFRPLVAPAIALGTFDGVHRGHQQLIQATLAASRRLGGDAVVLTFDPHPVEVLAPQVAPPLLTSRERKLELLAEAGISACIVEPFTRELAALSAEEFARSILSDIIGARHIVVGYDFTYGHKRGGTTDTLRAFGAARGIEVEVIEPVAIPVDGDQVVVSSTRLRELVSAGRLAQARPLLGRDFEVEGTVIRGAGRGATIGIPTANIRPWSTRALLPKGGVYAVTAQILDADPGQPGAAAPIPGVANLGTVPTFVEQGALSLEVHLFDFSENIYDKKLRVRFIERLRGEQRFDGVDALVRQIHADMERARNILGVAG